MCQNAFAAGGGGAYSYSAPPKSLAGFGEGNRKEGMKRAGEEKGTEGKERKGRRGGEMEFRGDILRHGFRGDRPPRRRQQ